MQLLKYREFRRRFPRLLPLSSRDSVRPILPIFHCRREVVCGRLIGLLDVRPSRNDAHFTQVSIKFKPGLGFEPDHFWGLFGPTH